MLANAGAKADSLALHAAYYFQFAGDKLGDTVSAIKLFSELQWFLQLVVVPDRYRRLLLLHQNAFAFVYRVFYILCLYLWRNAAGRLAKSRWAAVIIGKHRDFCVSGFFSVLKPEVEEQKTIICRWAAVHAYLAYLVIAFFV